MPFPKKKAVNLCTKPDKRPPVKNPSRDRWTKDWATFDAADELAVRNGCWFDPVVGGYAVWWIERFCRLYEDRWAGTPAVLWGCKDCDFLIEDGVAIRKDQPSEVFVPEDAINRSENFIACRAAGHDLEWSYQWFMRLFGWMRFDEAFNCSVRRFRRADCFIPKKNAKTPRLAFLGFYLLCGDGVAGNHVYHAAVDGQQAKMLVGSHAEAAHVQSPELSRACTLNRSTQTFTYHFNHSTFLPLTTSTDKTQKSKEGLNGSVLLDELHVIDTATIKRIKRAGISRMEPVIAGMSTAGLDIISYGKARQDYGRDVIDGLKEDDGYLCEIHEAPQDTVLELLDEDEVVRIGRSSNPSWGVTIQEREFREDWRESRQHGLAQLADFGTYRLNIWQATSCPWISKASWDRCSMVYGIHQLEERYCSLGIDLSRTKDLTAAVFVFGTQRVLYALDGHTIGYDEARNVRDCMTEECIPEGYAVRVGRPIWPMFWSPENTVEKRRHLAPFDEWVQAGQLFVCPGDTIRHQQVFDQICEVADQLTVDSVYADPTYTEWLTERLASRYCVTRQNFQQGIQKYARPLDAFEGELLDGTFIHPNSGPLNWQAGHVHVRRDKKTRYRMPAKPTDDSDEPRTIDGFAALCMGYEHFAGTDRRSPYSTAGNLEL